MSARALWLCTLICVLLPTAAAADGAPAGKVSVAVTEFVSKGGVDQSKMDALSDMLANQIREMGPFKVIGKADIEAALHLEQQKTLLGCTDDSCLAELGGALGVRYMVVGNISLFGNSWLLNLKLLDVAKVEVAKGISRSITGAEDAFLNALPTAVYDLMLAVPGVELTDPGGVEKVDGDQPRTREGWFVPPGGRKGDFHLGLGLGISVSMPMHLSDNEIVGQAEQYFDPLDDDLYPAFWPNIFLGYNFTSWLMTGFRVGGTFGKAGKRERSAIEAALDFQGSMMTDSWLQPMAYFDAGFVFVRDLDPRLDKTEEGERYELLGLLFNLGIGLNLFASPNWFIGGRLGGTVRYHIGMFNRDSDGTLRRISGARALEIGVQFSLVTGYEF